jgi:octaprenyl-diphosphate synthase
MKAASLDPLLSLVSHEMEQVNAMILSRTGSDVLMIPEVAQHLISSGGKRLRPILTLALAQLAGYAGEGHIKLAASVEFMHTATLLHDDVVDDSDMRRGKPAARKLWGNEASVLVGDFLLGQAFKMMVEVGSLQALDSLSTAACVIAEGEVMQLNAAKKLTTDETLYVKIIYAKTAALFATACEVGPIIAHVREDARQAARAYGQNLGMAFQLMDDVLDYGGSSKSLGKNTGDDFREGKITLPVILSYAKSDEAAKAFWQRTLTQNDVRAGDFEIALQLLHKHNALEATLARARIYGENAKAALAIFPALPLKAALEEAVDYCVARAV